MTATPLYLVIAADRGVARHRRARARRARAISRFVSARAVSRRRRVWASRWPVVAGCAIGAPPSTTVLPLGLPDLPFHLRVDALSAFFLLLLGAAGARDLALLRRLFPLERGHRAGPHLLPVPRLPRGDGARARRRRRVCRSWSPGKRWRSSSFFLVTTEHRIPEIRRAGFLYLADRARRRDRDPALLRRAARRQRRLHASARCARSTLTGAWPTVAVLPRARRASAPRPGLLPLHVWLPEAHPAAPSPVSALMSGVMLKTAIYGLLRVAFDLLHGQLVVVGRGRARARPRDRAVRRRSSPPCRRT